MTTTCSGQDVFYSMRTIFCVRVRELTIDAQFFYAIGGYSELHDLECDDRRIFYERQAMRIGYGRACFLTIDCRVISDFTNDFYCEARYSSCTFYVFYSMMVRRAMFTAYSLEGFIRMLFCSDEGYFVMIIT